MLAPLGLRGDFDAPGLRALAAWLPADRLLFKDDLHPAFSSMWYRRFLIYVWAENFPSAMFAPSNLPGILIGNP